METSKNLAVIPASEMETMYSSDEFTLQEFVKQFDRISAIPTLMVESGTFDIKTGDKAYTGIRVQGPNGIRGSVDRVQKRGTEITFENLVVNGVSDATALGIRKSFEKLSGVTDLEEFFEAPEEL